MKNFKRFFSSMMIVVMIVAMAAACGKKEEATDTEELEVETEITVSEGKAKSEESAEEDVPVADEETAGMSESDIIEVKAAIRDAVIKEYLEPNSIAPEDFVWPPSNSSAWDYFKDLVIEYEFQHYADLEMDLSIPPSPEKEIFDAAFSGLIGWFEGSKENNRENYISSTNVLLPYQEVIASIDVTAE